MAAERTALRVSKEPTVVVEEPDFALIPTLTWVLFRPPIVVCQIHFLEEAFVPLGIDMPMLHGVGNIRGLDDVFNDNGGLAIDMIHRSAICVVVTKSRFPTLLTEGR